MALLTPTSAPLLHLLNHGVHCRQGIMVRGDERANLR